jgi:hypothetical protein
MNKGTSLNNGIHFSISGLTKTAGLVVSPVALPVVNLLALFGTILVVVSLIIKSG